MSSNNDNDMTSTSCTSCTNAADMMNMINEIDLSRVSRRVAKDHPEWAQERVDAAVVEYRKYLCMVKAGYSNLSPCLDVDEVWHAHILFTVDYMNDCNKVFGFFLHHVPFDEEAPEQEKEQQARGYRRTVVAYRKLFGELPPSQVWGTRSHHAGTCACMDVRMAGKCGGCMDVRMAGKCGGCMDVRMAGKCGGCMDVRMAAEAVLLAQGQQSSVTEEVLQENNMEVQAANSSAPIIVTLENLPEQVNELVQAANKDADADVLADADMEHCPQLVSSVTA
jgi:hypothetical protein